MLSVLRTHLVGLQKQPPALLPSRLLTLAGTEPYSRSPLQDFRGRAQCLRAAQLHRQLAHPQPGVHPQQTLQGLHGALVRGLVQTGEFNKGALFEIKKEHEDRRGSSPAPYPETAEKLRAASDGATAEIRAGRGRFGAGSPCRRGAWRSGPPAPGTSRPGRSRSRAPSAPRTSPGTAAGTPRLSCKTPR